MSKPNLETCGFVDESAVGRLVHKSTGSAASFLFLRGRKKEKEKIRDE